MDPPTNDEKLMWLHWLQSGLPMPIPPWSNSSQVDKNADKVPKPQSNKESNNFTFRTDGIRTFLSKNKFFALMFLDINIYMNEYIGII
jgi:hypothetical protein